MYSVIAPFTEQELQDMERYDKLLYWGCVPENPRRQKTPADPQIRAYRKAIGMTQRQFGAAVGVSLSVVGAWETGQTPPKWELMEARFPDIHKDAAKINAQVLKAQSRIYSYRRKHKIPIEEMADRLECSPAMIRQWEYGKKHADWERISAAYPDLTDERWSGIGQSDGKGRSGQAAAAAGADTDHP